MSLYYTRSKRCSSCWWCFYSLFIWKSSTFWFLYNLVQNFSSENLWSTDMWILGTYLCRRRICRQHSWTCVLRPSATSLSSDRPFFLTFCCCFARYQADPSFAVRPLLLYWTLCGPLFLLPRTRISGFWFDLWVWSQISDPSPFRVLICQGFFSSALGHPGIWSTKVTPPGLRLGVTCFGFRCVNSCAWKNEDSLDFFHKKKSSSSTIKNHRYGSQRMVLGLKSKLIRVCSSHK